eukprot:TRINITY_DN688_c1_g2_i1.p1 TRINITY_DN688_c1_g2~~TRINITY_DN688_c1_g2_i1.p1  ORF type:complete len:216 (-),score=68.18 TRINITY_DN688_c1_g2_i1:10-657(-)
MTNENISPEVLRRIIKELKDIEKNPLEGIKVTANDEDISEIQATIEGPADTPFELGLFKCRLLLGEDFPKAPPKAFFVTKIFHPNVSKKGEICVNTLKKDWKEDLGIKHILLTIKCLLIVPNPESALNEDASRLLLENYDDYFKHAKLYTSIHAFPSPSVAPSSPHSSAQETPSVDSSVSSSEKGKLKEKEKEKEKKDLKKEKSVKDSKKSLKRL